MFLVLSPPLFFFLLSFLVFLFFFLSSSSLFLFCQPSPLSSVFKLMPLSLPHIRQSYGIPKEHVSSTTLCLCSCQEQRWAQVVCRFTSLFRIWHNSWIVKCFCMYLDQLLYCSFLYKLVYTEYTQGERKLVCFLKVCHFSVYR